MARRNKKIQQQRQELWKKGLTGIGYRGCEAVDPATYLFGHQQKSPEIAGGQRRPCWDPHSTDHISLDLSLHFSSIKVLARPQAVWTVRTGHSWPFNCGLWSLTL